MSSRIPVLSLIVLICWNCAQQGSPTGGPRDTAPPLVIECEPPNYSTSFDANKIFITFDEYIVLDNVNQELVVSPPMEEKPEVKLRKKTLVVEFEEELLDSTTYTFNFGSAIKDLHEGNKLLNYEYVFSTGDVLDSMSVKGTLKYAEDLSVPEEPFSIMLYTDLRDSVPLLDIPLYVGRSDDSGVFSVNNLKPDIYKVFALKDGNFNFIFDLPTEVIGFLDTTLLVNADFARSLIEADTTGSHGTGATEGTFTTADSAKTEQPAAFREGVPDERFTVADPDNPEQGVYGADRPMPADSTASDSTQTAGPDYNSIFIDMVLFTEDVGTQYLMEDEREDRRLIRLVFARPLTDSFKYRFLPSGDPGKVEVLEDFSAERDSLDVWLLDSMDYKKDTLLMELQYTVKDSSNLSVFQTDTLVLSYRERRTSKKEMDAGKPEELRVETIRDKGVLELNSHLRLDLDFPLEGFRDSLISLWHIPDTVEVPMSFSAVRDTASLTRGWIRADWESLGSYRLRLLPGAVRPVYPIGHDTIDITFKARDIEYYGRILLNLENVNHPVIIQVRKGEDIIRNRVTDREGQVEFSYVKPGDYKIKFIHDLNGNGKWDTGNYLEKRQPEPVEFYPKGITVRSNWDHDVTMMLRH